MEKSVEKILVLTDTTIAAVHKSNRKRHEQCIGKPLQCIFNFLFRRRVINEKNPAAPKAGLEYETCWPVVTRKTTVVPVGASLAHWKWSNPDPDQRRENHYASFVHNGLSDLV